MKKIKFVNGTTIDAAETFNNMQTNIEEVFNGKEPMGSIRVDDITSSNLFNIDDITPQWAIYGNNEGSSATLTNTSGYIPVTANQLYTFSCDYSSLASEGSRS